MRIHALAVLVASLLPIASPVLAQGQLSVDWEWKSAHRCSATSPTLMIAGIPSDTRTLEVTLVDHDAMHFNHGGGSAPHSGGETATLPEGALQKYQGPCPPNFSSFGHDYEFKVRAIAADGISELARGSKTRTFSAKTVKD